MGILNDMKLGKKMGALVLIAVFSLCMVGGLGYYDLIKANGSLHKMYTEQFVPNDYITTSFGDVRAVNGFLLELMLTADDKKNQALKKSIDDTAEKINKELAEVEKIPLDAKAKEMLAKIKSSQQLYRNARTEVIALAMQNKNAEAYALYTAKLENLANAYINDLDELSKYYTYLAKKNEC